MATLQATQGRTAARRRTAGTTLVEILVVIVIFLIGILAVVQVFPRGFRLLLVSRNNSVATALGRDEVERMKANPAGVMEQVLPVVYINGIPQVDTTINPLALGPQGDAIDPNGLLTRGGANAMDWMLASGANNARRIVGEGARVPAPRSVGNLYGGLLVLEHGPLAQNSPIVAYANDLSRLSGPPVEARPNGAYVPFDSSLSVQARSADGSTNLGPVNALRVETPANISAAEFYLVNAATAEASLLLPTSVYDRVYRIRLSGYAGTDPTGYSRVDWVSLSLFVPAKNPQDATTPLIVVRVADLLGASGVLGGRNFVGLESDTVRVAPQFVPVPVPTTAAALALWQGDAFRMVVTDPVLGCLVFSPAGREGTIDRPGGVSEPLTAKVDYDVYDWRILREDFRASSDDPSFTLSLQGLKVGSETGPDGRKNGGLFNVAQWPGASNIDPAADASTPGNYSRDNVAVIDLATGFQVQEYASADTGPNGKGIVDKPLNDGNARIRVDKSRGVVTLVPTSSGTVQLLSPTGGMVSVRPANRAFRVLYRAKNEWSVQLVKSASRYDEVSSFQVGYGKYLVGGSAAGGDATKIYFPASDIGRKVTIDRIVYAVPGGTQTLEGQDFVIQRPGAGAATNLGNIDLTTVDPNATGFVRTMGGTRSVEPVRGVKGASVLVRVLWNPEAFAFTNGAAENMTRVDQWGRSWRRSVTETYLRAEESR